MSQVILPQSLNICLIARKFPFLGSANENGFFWPVAKGLVRKGHSVTVISSSDSVNRKEIFQDGGSTYYLMPRSSTGGRFDFLKSTEEQFKKLHEKKSFHLIHSLDDSAHLIARQKKKYQIATSYDVEVTGMAEIFSILGMAQESLTSLLRTGMAITLTFLRNYYAKDRSLLKMADGVFVTSPIQRLVLERYYLYPDSRIFTVPYGIEISEEQNKEKSSDLRKKLGIAETSPTVVTITDMNEIGEMKNLLLAFQKVAIKKPSARLLIIGDGPKKKEIEFAMLQMALGSRVLFVGPVHQSELPLYISVGNIFVNLSSRTTGFEPSTLEAMAQEKIIIGSEMSPLATIVEDGQDGFLIRPADVNTLANLILDIFAGHLLAPEIGRSARQKVLNLFDTEKMIEKTLQAYFAILKRSGFYRK